MAYLLFLLTTLYGIGFTGGFVVPKALDDGVRGPLWAGLLMDLMLIGLFGIQHSLMARASFKAWWLRRVPEPVERSVFVLAASLLLLLLFWQWRPLPGVVWSFAAGTGHVLLTGAFWLGWLAVVLSTFLIDHFDLFGLRQVWLYWRGIAYSPVPFKEAAILRYVRHPLMLSFVIAFWATSRMTVGHLVFAAGMTTYILIGIAFEERDLVRTFGTAYERYRQQVSMLLPLPPKGSPTEPQP
jgi:protein-S-isoprenylcysteine O-methyltransferase Ste14